MPKSMTYEGAGVNYGDMDSFKRKAQMAAAETDRCLERFGFQVVPWSRGESAFLIETPRNYLAFVVEGLGTKNLVADAMYDLAETMQRLTGKSYYDHMGQCNVAMAVNDLITSGALPLCYGQYVATGTSDWFKDERRYQDLIDGTKRACLLARCAWGGGESSTIKGITIPGTSDLAGATMGIINPKERLINPTKIQHGDAIILFESSGVHANGYTLARELAEKLPDGYLTKIGEVQFPDHVGCGRSYGDVLLDSTFIYVPLMEELLNRGIDIHYAVNITGHGWRKLMRASGSFSYVIERLPRPQQIFHFIQQQGGVSDEEMYKTFNMGAGFAIYVAERDVDAALEANRAIAPVNLANYHDAFKAGHIENSETKKVVIKPKDLIYSAETLAIR